MKAIWDAENLKRDVFLLTPI